MRTNTIVLIICCLFLVNNIGAQTHPNLITFIEDSPNFESVKSAFSSDKNVISLQEIKIDAAVLCSNDTVEIPLDGENITVVMTYSSIDEHVNYVYKSYESAGADVYVSKLGDDIQGAIHANSGTYFIETYENLYVLKKYNTDEAPAEGEPIIPETINKAVSNTDNKLSNSSPATIRVLVMYTPEALASNSTMINKVYSDINSGNESFINSNVNAKFEIAYIGKTVDSETGLSFSDLLSKFQTINDGKFDEVHTLRDKYSADVCVLLVNNSQKCGLGYIGGGPSYSFAVVCVSSPCAWKYSFTHEIGHNIGCEHDTNNSNTPSYNHGYIHYIPGDTAHSWRTMMAYSDVCGSGNNCKRIKYWSNPYIAYQGYSTGTATLCDNARVWNENAPDVSGYRLEPFSRYLTNSDNSNSMNYAHYKVYLNIVTQNGYVVESGQVVRMSAFNSVILREGTRIKAGSNFIATTNLETPSYQQRISQQYSDDYHQENNFQRRRNNITVFPNPASTEVDITIDLQNEKQSVSIMVMDISGQLLQKVTDANDVPQGLKKYTINVTPLSIGIFFVVIKIDNTPYVYKILKQ